MCVSQQLVAVSVGDKCGLIHRYIKEWASGYVEWEEGIESHPRIGLHESCGIVTHLCRSCLMGWSQLFLCECWADHETGCCRGGREQLSEQYWLAFECLTSIVDMSGGGRFLCVVMWWCRCSRLGCHSMPRRHGSASHTLDLGWLESTMLLCQLQFCPGALSLPPTPHHASASGASWTKIIVAWCVFEISMMFSS